MQISGQIVYREDYITIVLFQSTSLDCLHQRSQVHSSSLQPLYFQNNAYINYLDQCKGPT